MLNQKYLLIPFFLFMILLAACQSIPAATPAPTTAVTQIVIADTPTASAAPTAGPTMEANRYANDEGKFSLALPEGWSAHGPLVIDSDPARPYNLYVLGVDPSSSGGPGPSKIAILDPQQWTPEAFAQSQCTTCPAQPFEDSSLGDKPARRTQVGGGDVPFMVTWVFVENNGKLIALDIHDPETMVPLEEVLQSLQLQ